MEDFGFKFKIGDRLQTVVYMPPRRDDSESWRATSEERRRPSFVVVSRILEECPGGVQRHYHCRMMTGDGHVAICGRNATGLFIFNEIELVPYVAAS